MLNDELMHNKRVVSSRSALFLLNAWLSQNLYVNSVFFQVQ